MVMGCGKWGTTYRRSENPMISTTEVVRRILFLTTNSAVKSATFTSCATKYVMGESFCLTNHSASMALKRMDPIEQMIVVE